MSTFDVGIDAEPLSSVLITGALYARSLCPLDSERVNEALRQLGRTITEAPNRLLESLVTITLELCGAGTAGLSVLERNGDGILQFRWDYLAGALAGFVGGTTPRDWSPCGVTLDLNSPQLFQWPARHFTYFRAANPEIIEGLVLPIVLEDGVPYGTLWIVSHDDRRKFNSEDVRVMQSLCSFTAAAARILGFKPRLWPS